MRRKHLKPQVSDCKDRLDFDNIYYNQNICYVSRWQLKSTERHCFVVSLTLDDHPCSGNLELDFRKQCKLMGVKKIPSVKLKQSKSVMGKYVVHKTIMFCSPIKDASLMP